MNVVVGVLILVGFGGTLLGIVVGFVTFGRRRGYGDFVAPDLPRPPRPEWPLLCRLHVWHRWRTFRNSDEVRYQRCIGCGMTRDIPFVPPI